MLHFFNRSQLITILDLNQREAICAQLSQNHIDYTVKTVNRASSSIFGSGSRARGGTLFQDYSQNYHYIIYVNKKDLDYAQHCIRQV